MARRHAAAAVMRWTDDAVFWLIESCRHATGRILVLVDDDELVARLSERASLVTRSVGQSPIDLVVGSDIDDIRPFAPLLVPGGAVFTAGLAPTKTAGFRVESAWRNIYRCFKKGQSK